MKTKKICSKCGIEKPIWHFWKQKKGRDGRRADCKDCSKLPASPLKTERRFWEKVDKKGDDECWEWTGDKSTSGGYGKFWLNGKRVMAHRYVLELQSINIPDDKVVCHKCDNPPCVNPNHLFIGTPLDNSRDASIKGRHGKLKPKQVKKIKAILRQENMPQQEIGELFGVCQQTISQIKTGFTWGQLDKEEQI